MASFIGHQAAEPAVGDAVEADLGVADVPIGHHAGRRPAATAPAACSTDVQLSVRGLPLLGAVPDVHSRPSSSRAWSLADRMAVRPSIASATPRASERRDQLGAAQARGTPQLEARRLKGTARWRKLDDAARFTDADGKPICAPAWPIARRQAHDLCAPRRSRVMACLPYPGRGLRRSCRMGLRLGSMRVGGMSSGMPSAAMAIAHSPVSRRRWCQAHSRHPLDRSVGPPRCQGLMWCASHHAGWAVAAGPDAAFVPDGQRDALVTVEQPLGHAEVEDLRRPVQDDRQQPGVAGQAGALVRRR